MYFVIKSCVFLLFWAPGRTSAGQGPSGRGLWGPGVVFLMILGGGRVPPGGEFGALGAPVFDIL